MPHLHTPPSSIRFGGRRTPLPPPPSSRSSARPASRCRRTSAQRRDRGRRTRPMGDAGARGVGHVESTDALELPPAESSRPAGASGPSGTAGASGADGGACRRVRRRRAGGRRARTRRGRRRQGTAFDPLERRRRPAPVRDRRTEPSCRRIPSRVREAGTGPTRRRTPKRRIAASERRDRCPTGTRHRQRLAPGVVLRREARERRATPPATAENDPPAFWRWAPCTDLEWHP
jgi:hypothetical protein